MKSDADIQYERDLCQLLGRALGYPRYCDDQKTFPGSTDADGVCTADQTSMTLAKQVVRRLERPICLVDQSLGWDRPCSLCGNPDNQMTGWIDHCTCLDCLKKFIDRQSIRLRRANGRFSKAIALAEQLMAEVDSMGGCDHANNICYCDDRKMIADLNYEFYGKDS